MPGSNRGAGGKRRPEAALVMLSNFGPADGGRETWAYSFIPRLLSRHPHLRLSIYGLRIEGEPDNSALLEAIDLAGIEVEFIPAPRSRTPNAFHFWRGLRALPTPSIPPRFVLAVGSFVELLAVLRSPAFRGSAKICWLRTVFADEKAHRYPRALRSLLLAIEGRVLRKADLLIANGDDTAAFYREQGLGVTVIRNAIDFSRWERPPATFDKPMLNVAFIGRLGAVKGIREFVALVRQWNRPRVRFHVVGFGPEEELVRQAETAGKLIFHGSVPNDRVRDLLGEFDVCVALTFKSPNGGTGGVSNALLEQMAAGRVIIAWRNEIFEQILDDSSAYLVEQGSVAGLVQGVSEIIDQPDQARRKAERAQEIARAHSFEEHMEQFDRAVLAGLDLS